MRVPGPGRFAFRETQRQVGWKRELARADHDHGPAESLGADSYSAVVEAYQDSPRSAHPRAWLSV